MSKVAKAVGAVVVGVAAVIVGGPLFMPNLGILLMKFSNLGFTGRDANGREWIAQGLLKSRNPPDSP